MGKVIDRLEFAVYMNRDLKCQTFDQLFAKEDFLMKFTDFISSPQGTKWLTKPEGKLYTVWQSSS